MSFSKVVFTLFLSLYVIFSIFEILLNAICIVVSSLLYISTLFPRILLVKSLLLLFLISVNIVLSVFVACLFASSSVKFDFGFFDSSFGFSGTGGCCDTGGCGCGSGFSGTGGCCDTGGCGCGCSGTSVDCDVDEY